MAKTFASLQAFPFSLLPHAWSHALIPFPVSFECLPRAFHTGYIKGEKPGTFFGCKGINKQTKKAFHNEII